MTTSVDHRPRINNLVQRSVDVLQHEVSHVHQGGVVLDVDYRLQLMGVRWFLREVEESNLDDPCKLNSVVVGNRLIIL